MTRTRRPGFTLVELLVVMSLMIVLAGLTVAVAESGAFGSQKVVSAGDRASGWLLIARQRALRDQRPRGVRFLITQNATTGNYESREAQYIEVPDAWVPDRTKPTAQRAYLAFVYQQSGLTPPNTFVTDPAVGPPQPNPYTTKFPANAQRVFVVFPDPAEYAEFTQRVFAGSLLTLPGTGATYRIDQLLGPQSLSVLGPPVKLGIELVLGQNTASQVPPGSAGAPQFTYPDLGATVSPPSAAATGPHQVSVIEYNFAFTAGFSGGTTGTGGPQPLVGEPLLQLTGNTVIDVRRYPNTPALTTSNGFNTTFLSVAGTNPDSAVAYPTSAGVQVAGNATAGFFIDVLFSPSGQVLGASDGLICLWVRDPDKTTGGSPRYFSGGVEGRTDPNGQTGFDSAGEQKLVVVYTRTGLIATHEILPPNGTATYDPYSTARDGLNSGL